MNDKPLWDWDGPYGGLPPYDRATPAAIERDFKAAVALRTESLAAIAANPAAPDFDNTIVALEAAGEPLKRVMGVFQVVTSTATSPAMRDVEQRLAPLTGVLDDEVAHNAALFTRVDAVYARRETLGLEADQRRLVETTRARLIRLGGALPPADRQALADLNARIAAASAKFVQNFSGDEVEQFTLIETEAELDGLDDAARAAAARLAAERGHPGAWAIANVRQSALAFLAKARDRGARERVWRLWNARGENPGERDNRPLMAEILRLRGRKARLLGYPNFAALQLSDRMARTPEKAMDLLLRAWDRVRPATERHMADLQQLAAADGQTAPIAPWDRYYYAEKYRRSQLGLDAAEVRQYLTVEGVIGAVLEAASRLHGIDFEPLPCAPVLAPTIRPLAVSRGGEPVGVVYIDIIARDSKRRGSWQSEARPASSYNGRVLPVSNVVTSVDPAPEGQRTVMAWESANVIFHEFGHGLHMLLGESRYPSLGSMGVAWDMVELPALLNERWLYDAELLRRHMRHATTGEPIPLDLIERIQAGARHDRVFSVNADYLIGAVTDLRIYLAADGSEIDAVAVEAATRAELGMPDGIDLLLRMPNFFHVFGSEHYAAGVYSYLWADVMAADVAERFLEAEGGLYDAATSALWRRTILSAGNSVPADEAYRAFIGRDPDPGALMRRFGLDAVA